MPERTPVNWYFNGPVYHYLKENPQKNIRKKICERIFERKSAKKYSKENPRKNTRKKINEEYFCENLLWEKIDKGIKAFIAFNEALNNSSVRKTTDFLYGPA